MHAVHSTPWCTTIHVQRIQKQRGCSDVISRDMSNFPMLMGCVFCAQVDVTAEDSKAGPGQIPDVDPAAVKAAEPASGVMGVAQRQFGAGWAVQDPWHAIRAGVAPVKPHKAQVGAALDSNSSDMRAS